MPKSGQAPVSAAQRQASQPLGDQPWYIKAIVWVGAPTAAAGYLLWFVLATVAGHLDAMATTLEKHQQDMTALVAHLQQDTQQTWVQLGVMQRICLNTSRTDADRLACVSIKVP